MKPAPTITIFRFFAGPWVEELEAVAYDRAILRGVVATLDMAKEIDWVATGYREEVH